MAKFLPALAAIIVLGVVTGCATLPQNATPDELLAHDINVPAAYRGGDPWPGFDGEINRYVYAYEHSWWTCIKTFANDIDHQTTLADTAGNGGVVSISGYHDGYAAAEARVRKLIRRFGKERTQQVLQKSLQPPKFVN